MRIRHQIDDLGDGKQADERGHEGDAAVERFMDDETGFPVRVLYPTVDSNMPSAPPNSPLSMAPEESPVMTVMPKMAVQNSSEGPKRMANSAIGGENRIMTSTPNTPPIRGAYKNGVEGFLGPSLLGHRIPVEQRGDA